MNQPITVLRPRNHSGTWESPRACSPLTHHSQYISWIGLSNCVPRTVYSCGHQQQQLKGAPLHCFEPRERFIEATARKFVSRAEERCVSGNDLREHA